MNAVTVYFSSSDFLDADFHETAKVAGRELAQRDIEIIYGGGCVGLMGELARSARAHGGRTIGIITKHLLEREQGDPQCDQLLVVDTMRERKRQLVERGDGFLILPGGLGTYEEMFETIVGRQLQEHNKPIGIVNAHGFFNPLIAMIEHGIEHKFIKPAVYELFTIDPDPAVVIEWLLAPEQQELEIDDDRFLPMGRETGPTPIDRD